MNPNLASGKPIRRWATREGANVILMPAGERALESYYDQSWMRNLQTGAIIWSLHRAATVGLVLPSPDGHRVTSVGPGYEGTRLHDSADGKVIWQHPAAEPLAFSADGRTLYLRTYDWHLLALDVTDGSLRLQIDRQRTETRAFYPSVDGKFGLASSGKDLSGYDLEHGKQLWRIEGSEYGHAILPDGAVFVSHEHRTMRLRSTATGLDLAPPLPLDGLPGSVIRFIVTADGKAMFLTSGEGLIFRLALDPAAAASGEGRTRY
ncbi:MAG TPA: PQQ-binding-like beta-propeller repeat protein [Polyangia bacterium]|nr:PQQ-binding-like beta-propeller repeat protein [Polyangia bacterium]